MHLTGIEEHYKLRDGKKLRFGYTTGACAAAAAQAAARLLALGTAPALAELDTPSGIRLSLEVAEASLTESGAVCAVRKYSGDDPDVTDGVLVYAQASWLSSPGVEIDGGEGVGRVTKPGLKLPVGSAAINPVPRQMISREARRVLEECGGGPGLRVVISIPAGTELARRTFNPRLGIEGGISVLGTSGIVEPMSEAALVESIGLELRQKRALGCQRLLVVPGNYGADFLRSLVGARAEETVKCSNYIGQTIDMAEQAGYRELLLVGHIGKLVKLGGGIMNTHSHQADCRAEIMAACALRAGAPAGAARELLDCLTTDGMLELLDREGLLSRTMRELGARMELYLRARAGDKMTVAAAAYSESTGILCTAGPAEKWIRELEERP